MACDVDELARRETAEPFPLGANNTPKRAWPLAASCAATGAGGIAGGAAPAAATASHAGPSRTKIELLSQIPVIKTSD
jgi:hypothetical protein